MASVNDKLFQAISIIVEDSINKSTKTLTIKGKVEQKIERTDSYKINYQNTEIVASSMGQAYNNGDEVFVLLPNGNLQTEKFILGKTNNRVPSIIYDAEGLSPETIRLIQEINDKIKDIVSDGVVYPSEKVVLKTQWELIKKSYEEINEQYLPYKDEIDMSKARNAYELLEQIMNEILADMTTESKVDSTLITNSMEEYLKEDNAVRLRISEELRKELLYKVEIISTNGNIFKNGIISTKLRTKIMKGRKDVTLDIAANSILWQKMNADGTILPSWEKRGHEIEITTSDVNEKQIFVCSIIVDRATVAQELITIIDVEDISQITTSINYVVPVSQTLSLETNKYSPDYRDLNLVLTSVVKQGGKLLSSGPIRKWTLDGKEIISNEDMQINSNGSTLTIKNNILNNSKRTGIIKCEVKYEDKEAEITLDDFDTINLSLSVDGRNGVPGQPGENGKTQYTHIAYGDNDKGSGFTFNPAGKKFMGITINFVQQSPTDPGLYKWSLIKGEDGKQGIPGDTGPDGKTSYFHTAWSNSPDGKKDFTTSYPKENLLKIVKDKEYTASREFVSSVDWDMAPSIDKYGLKQPITYTFEIKGKVAGKFNFYFQNGSGSKHTFENYKDSPSSRNLTTEWVKHTIRVTSHRISSTTETRSQIAFFSTYDSGAIMTIRNLKAELGEYATPGIETPIVPLSYMGTYTDFEINDSEDPSKYTWAKILEEPYKTHKAWAWSSDGKDRFTDKYPNENLIVNRMNDGINYPMLANNDLAGFTARTNNERLSDNSLKVTTTEATDPYFRPLNRMSPQSLGGVGAKLYLSFDYEVPNGSYLRLRIINFVGRTEKFYTGKGSDKIELTVSGSTTHYLSFDPTKEQGSVYEVGLWYIIKNLKIENDDFTIYTPSPKDDFENAYPSFEGYYSTVSDEPQSQNPDDYVWSRSLGGSTNVFHAWANSPDGIKDFSINPATINLFSVKEFNIRKTVSKKYTYVKEMDIKVKPNTNYRAESRVKMGTDGFHQVWIYIPGEDASSASNGLSLTSRIVKSSSDGYLRIGVHDTATVNTTDQWIQIVEGDKNKPYMPSALDDEDRASYSYMGVQVKVSDIQSTDPADYKWTKVNGDDNTVVGSKNLFLPTDVYIEGTPNNIASSKLGFYSTNLVSNTDNLWIKISNSDNSYFNTDNIGEKRTFSFKYQLNEGKVVSLGGDLSPFESYKIYIDNILISEDIINNPVPINPDKMIHKISISGIVRDMKGVQNGGDIFIRPNQKEGYPHKYNINLFDFQIEEGEKATGFAPSYLLNMTQEDWEKIQKEIDDKINEKADEEDMMLLQELLEQLKNSYESFVSDGGKYEEDLKKFEERTVGMINSLGEQVAVYEFLTTYIRLGEEGLMIGKEDDPMQMMLGKDRLSFMDGGKEVAYFSNQSFYINRGAIVDSLQIGVHKFSKYSDKGTVVQYVGA